MSFNSNIFYWGRVLTILTQKQVACAKLYKIMLMEPMIQNDIIATVLVDNLIIIDKPGRNRSK